MKNQRQIKNILINPGIQFRLFVPYLVMLAIATLLLNGVLFFIVSTVHQVFPDMTPEQSEELNRTLFRSVIASAVGLSVMAFLGFALTTVLSHRLLGPLVPIRRHLQKLIEGKYDDRLRLRKTDELHFLADDLNKLTEKLGERSKNSVSGS